MLFFFLQVSVALLLFCSVYMLVLLPETVKPCTEREHHSQSLNRVFGVVQQKIMSMRYAATIVFSRYICSYTSFSLCYPFSYLMLWLYKTSLLHILPRTFIYDLVGVNIYFYLLLKGFSFLSAQC